MYFEDGYKEMRDSQEVEISNRYKDFLQWVFGALYGSTFYIVI
jgi:hypothetical protein